MARRQSRKKLFAQCRWSVETPAIKDMPRLNAKTGDWVQIYCASSKPKAKQDAKKWTVDTGQKTRIVRMKRD